MAVNDWFKGSPVDPFPGPPPWIWAGPDKISMQSGDYTLFLTLARRERIAPPSPVFWAGDDSRCT